MTGLLTGQTVTRTSDSSTLLNLTYGYDRGNSNGNLSGKTGQLTHITNGLDSNKERSFEFDALGRLKAAKGGGDAGASGVTAHWTQNYSYDRYGNKTGVTATGTTVGGSNPVPTDGLPSLAYDTTSNRINTSGWQYDNAGNLVRGQNQNGVWQRFEYDAAGRLAKIKDDSNNPIETYTYGADRNRLTNDTGSQKTYYAWGGSVVLQEYIEATGTTTPVYSKAYVYAGTRLLSTATNVSGSEVTEYHHPDRLGTKVVTNPSANTSYEQSTLPFGTALNAESNGYSNQTFTSYDRSSSTGLDYAVNRAYSSGQGRFTQVDPIGIAASSADPQSLNLYSYTRNSPTDYIDPSGLKEELVCFGFGDNQFCISAEVPRGVPDPPIKSDPSRGGGGHERPDNSRSHSPGPFKKCSAKVPAAADSKSILNTILGEGTGAGYIGKNEYGDNQAGTYEKGKVPAGNGPQITYDSLVGEETMLAYDIYARLYAKNYPKSIQGVISDPNAVLKGYQSDNARLQSYENSAESSAKCETLKAAIDGLNRAQLLTNLPDSGFNFIQNMVATTEQALGHGIKIEWRSVRQGNSIISHPNSTRIAGTDFLPWH